MNHPVFHLAYCKKFKRINFAKKWIVCWFPIFSVNIFYPYSLSFRLSRKSFHRISFGSWIITIWNSAATHFYYKYL